MWRPSAKRVGAATTGVILALSSWRTWFGSERRHQESRSDKLHLAKCTENCNEALPVPDATVDPSPIETSTSSSNALFSSTQIKTAIGRCRGLMSRAMLERGIPGGVVAVMKDGVLVWNEGVGYADVENAVPCRRNTPMRIASISKPLTAVALLQLWQKGLVDLDAPVQEYVPEFPEKECKGEKVVVTTRQLLSHMAGIRHYTKVTPQNEAESSANTAIKEFEQEEYYINTHFDSVMDSVKLFASDELLSKPGTEFHYTTHGWTLISAVLEKVSDKQFLQYMADHVFKPLGMLATRGEFHQELIYNRARYYVRRDGGLLQNTPYVDISYKWAGGGLISTAHDLTKFGNALLTCYQFHAPNSTATQCHPNDNSFVLTKEGRLHEMKQSTTSRDVPNLNCILDPDTISMMWTPVAFPYKTKAETGYGMGWVVRKGSARTVGGRSQPFYAAHSGAAIGASSVLVIMPAESDTPSTSNDNVTTKTRFIEPTVELECEERCRCVGASKMVPKGVVVAVLFNLQEVSNITSLGVQIAEEFLQIQSQSRPQHVISFCHNNEQ